ncbi:helix-turn-helix domain-containing protein [Sphingorhabdus sp.]|jgi:predicted transcriptional regulator|uniref:helix-turn-helix domain-containing protein n=1 Tax=Sphingorhabdus sp. TaxID=1902408 RepID=UPI0037C5AF0E
MARNTPFRLIYAAKIRAARGLLNWSQGELAERAGVSKQSITRIEKGIMDPRFSTMTALNEAIRSTGVDMSEDGSGKVMITISREKLMQPSASTLLGKLSEP